MKRLRFRRIVVSPLEKWSARRAEADSEESIFKQKISETKELDKIKYLDDFDVTINGKYNDGSESKSEYKLWSRYIFPQIKLS